MRVRSPPADMNPRGPLLLLLTGKSGKPPWSTIHRDDGHPAVKNVSTMIAMSCLTLEAPQ